MKMRAVNECEMAKWRIYDFSETKSMENLT